MAASDSSLTARKERWARKMSGKAKPSVRSESRLPPGQHLTPGFPVLDLGIRPEISLGEWRLEIGGLVENPQTLTWAQFNSLPQFEDLSDFHCVTTWSQFDMEFEGVAFFTIADLVKPKPEATHAVLLNEYHDFLDGAATLKLLRLETGSGAAPKIALMVVLPNQVKGRVPVFLAMNFCGNHALSGDPRIPLTKGWLYEHCKGCTNNAATEAARGGQRAAGVVRRRSTRPLGCLS